MDKQLTLRRLPGSPETYLVSLNRIFDWVKNNQPVYSIPLANWIRDNIGWKKSYSQAAGFVIKTFLKKDEKGTVLLSEWACQWLGVDDFIIKSELLYDYLNDRVYFFGEILDLLMDSPKTAEDILDSIVDKHPKWNTAGVLRDRLDWLLACGVVHMLGGKYCHHPILQDNKDQLVKQYQDKINIGEIGEQYALIEEKNRLATYTELTKRIRRVSTYAPRAGYDIQSYFPDGRLKFIEVKSTSGKDGSFEMTENEWSTARRLGDSYFIYRVTEIGTGNPKLQIIQNPANKLHRTPLAWKVHNTPQELVEEQTRQGLKASNDIKINVESLALPRESVYFVVNDQGERGEKSERIDKITLSLIEEIEEIFNCNFCGKEGTEIVIYNRRYKRYGGKFRPSNWEHPGNISLCLNCFLKLRDLLL